MQIQHKIERLHSILEGMPKAAVAFSGGVDSSFLAVAARVVLGGNLPLLMMVSPLLSKRERDHARRVAGEIGLSLIAVPVELHREKGVRENMPSRCYDCKKTGFDRLLRLAGEMDRTPVIHGVNTDDLKDYRPGLKAANELGIRSPLVEADFSKTDIRKASKMIGLSTWDYPSQSCLATRFPYGETLTREKLARVEKAEAYLEKIGFNGVRVRSHGDLARIECRPEDFEKVVDYEIRDPICLALRQMGFSFVSLDLEGYGSGRMNRELTSPA